MDMPGPDRSAEEGFQRRRSSDAAPCRTAPYGQAALDGGIAVVTLSAALAGRRSLPGHRGIEPDRERAAALKRFVVARPVPDLVGRACRPAHAVQLPRWIRQMNPGRRFVQQSHLDMLHHL